MEITNNRRLEAPKLSDSPEVLAAEEHMAGIREDLEPDAPEAAVKIRAYGSTGALVDKRDHWRLTPAWTLTGDAARQLQGVAALCRTHAEAAVIYVAIMAKAGSAQVESRPIPTEPDGRFE